MLIAAISEGQNSEELLDCGDQIIRDAEDEYRGRKFHLSWEFLEGNEAIERSVLNQKLQDANIIKEKITNLSKQFKKCRKNIKNTNKTKLNYTLAQKRVKLRIQISELKNTLLLLTSEIEDLKKGTGAIISSTGTPGTEGPNSS